MIEHNVRYRLLRIFLCTLVLISLPAMALTEQTQSKEHKLDKVLFVGNSFSFYNNGIHNHLGSLIRANGQWQRGKNRLRLQTLSGGHIYEHLEGLQATLTNDNRGWQAVVLQAHSNEAILDTKKARFASSLAKAIDIVRSHQLQPILFMTWAYKGDDDMAQDLLSAYIEQANMHQIPLVPVGLAFAEAAKLLPNIELYVQDVLGIKESDRGSIITYQKDLKHPSRAGTYLAACVFYASLYQ